MKLQVQDVLSQMETTGGESGPLNNSTTCPEALLSSGQKYGVAQILPLEQEDWHFDSRSYSNIGAEAISAEEFLAEKAYDSLCKTLQINAEANTSSGFLIRHDGLIVRKEILDSRHQVVLLRSLRNKLLALSHTPAVSGHLGTKRMHLTMRQEYY